MCAREVARGALTATELPEGGLEAEFAGVNLDAALEECYERMAVIGRWAGCGHGWRRGGGRS